MGLYDFEMKMCCSMQIESLKQVLKQCKLDGKQTDCIVHPRFPAAPRNDSLFDSMNLFAEIDKEGKVELSGVVFYWNHIDGDFNKRVIIEHFPDIDACIEWLRSDDISAYIASKLKK